MLYRLIKVSLPSVTPASDPLSWEVHRLWAHRNKHLDTIRAKENRSENCCWHQTYKQPLVCQAAITEVLRIHHHPNYTLSTPLHNHPTEPPQVFLHCALYTLKLLPHVSCLMSSLWVIIKAVATAIFLGLFIVKMVSIDLSVPAALFPWCTLNCCILCLDVLVYIIHWHQTKTIPCDQNDMKAI